MLKSGELFALMAKSRGDSVGKAWFLCKTMLYLFNKKQKDLNMRKRNIKRNQSLRRIFFYQNFSKG